VGSRDDLLAWGLTHDVRLEPRGETDVVLVLRSEEQGPPGLG
jgi:hypothetical protein